MVASQFGDFDTQLGESLFLTNLLIIFLYQKNGVCNHHDSVAWVSVDDPLIASIFATGSCVLLSNDL